MKVYILTEHSGQYEDYTVETISVCSTREKAEVKRDAIIKEHKDNEAKYIRQTRAIDDVYIEWDETLKDKYIAGGLSLQQANEKFEESLDSLEEIDYYDDEDYWYKINEFELE